MPRMPAHHHEELPVENLADRDERIVRALERIGDVLELIEEHLAEMNDRAENMPGQLDED